ncbi:MAG: hypothetical protein WA974_11450 [Thermodesulfobacteriota bacterium]
MEHLFRSTTLKAALFLFLVLSSSAILADTLLERKLFGHGRGSLLEL